MSLVGSHVLVGVVCVILGYWLGVCDLKNIMDDDDELDFLDEDEDEELS